MRKSIQRQMILDAMGRLDHPAAAQVYDHIREQYPAIGLGTVYRNLSRMAREGILTRLSPPDGPDRFEVRRRRHDHVLCGRCGAVADLEGIAAPLARRLEDEAAVATGYAIDGFSLYFNGLCPRCRGD